MTTPTVAPYKQLRRPLDDRIVAGVCSGIGRYLAVDPVLVRVGFVVLAALTWGAALLAYPIAWFLMPEEPAPLEPVWRDPADPTWVSRRRRSDLLPLDGAGGLARHVEHHPVDLRHLVVTRVEIFAMTSYGRRDQSAVMASSLETGRSTTGCP
jgi:phage shock protein PspC (stress-responsive transcriptional regulator)